MENSAAVLTRPLTIPVFASYVEAGFPSPTDDYIESSFDLERDLIRHPSATFMFKVKGDSMSPYIQPGDSLIVDRSVTARHDDVVVASLNGDFTVKKLFHRGGMVSLVPMNSEYPSIDVMVGFDFRVWGVVTAIIRKTCTHS